MEINVLASTKEGYKATRQEFDMFSGKQAKVCYMTKDYQAIDNASEQNILRITGATKSSFHHSVFDHSKISLYLEGIPKLFAMLLNNEKDYDTNEKSGRYTKMVGNERENELYQKWTEKFERLIREKYGNHPYFDEKRISKLAIENARYMLSVMTPTNMTYTVSFRQLNYLCNWMKKLETSQNEIYQLLAPYAVEFVEKIKQLGYYDETLANDGEGREFSLIAKRVRREFFDENYSINYLGSFAMLAQEQRHRTLYYEFQQLPEKKFYLPQILTHDHHLVEEWFADISSLSSNHPQGELLAINERGTYENLIMKTRKRLCTQVQLESMQNIKNTVDRFISSTTNDEVRADLMKINTGARCTSGFVCNQPCGFKQGIDLSREI